jgi:hypothetical protein
MGLMAADTFAAENANADRRAGKANARRGASEARSGAPGRFPSLQSGEPA